MKQLVAIVGTNARHSTNRMLLQYLKKRYVHQADIEILEIAGLPIFKKTTTREIPQQAQQMAEKITQADGVIIGTPEYDHAVPAILLSTLAWLSYGIHPFLDKPVMITAASYGNLGASRAHAQLRQILDAPELKARILPSSEFLLGNSLQAFDERGDLIDQTKVAQLDGLFADFLVFLEIAQQLNHAHQANETELRQFVQQNDDSPREGV